MRRKWILLAPLVIVAFLLFVALGGEIVRRLWNGILPSLFGWPPITFWQALGLLLLCRILFGGFGGRGFSRSHSGRMTPEERERFRQGLRRRLGFGPSSPAASGAEATPGAGAGPGSE